MFRATSDIHYAPEEVPDRKLAVIVIGSRSAINVIGW
jgi:hypothetical protein